MKSLTNYICEAMQKKFNGFAILKPEFLDIKDDFEDMLEDAGWDITNYKTIKMNLDEARELYKVCKLYSYLNSCNDKDHHRNLPFHVTCINSLHHLSSFLFW